MAAGRRGVFAISWEQTEIDGMAGAPPEELSVGASWRWGGEALRVDGPAGLLPLVGSGAGRALECQVAAGAAAGGAGAPAGAPAPVPEPAEPPAAACFTVTDGRRAWAVGVAPGRHGPVLVLDGELPPPATELWVVRRSAALGRAAGAAQAPAGLVAGTRVATPQGPRLVEDLAPGDPVLTCDEGARPVLWVGRRTVSGARLRLRPALRPVRVPAATGPGGARGVLLVGPGQRLVLRGPAVAAAFGAEEVLAAAGDLVGGWPLRVDHGLATLSYVQLMFARHQLVLAEGRAVASFHPAEASLDPQDAAGRAGLEAAWPGLAADPDRFGPPARRLLSQAEAAILAHRPPPAG